MENITHLSTNSLLTTFAVQTYLLQKFTLLRSAMIEEIISCGHFHECTKNTQQLLTKQTLHKLHSNKTGITHTGCI